MNDIIVIIAALLMLLTLAGFAVHAYLPDTSPWKNPMRTRAEKHRAWEEARDYGRRYGSH